MERPGTTNPRSIRDLPDDRIALGRASDSVAEIRKLSRSPGKTIWHSHGSAELPVEKSPRLVLGNSDYDEVYLQSPIATTLHSLAQNHRLIFFVFGFVDADLLRWLNEVKRISSPDRPFFAFLGQEHPTSTDAQALRDKYRAEYNVEVVPYQQLGHDHSALNKIIEAYSDFIVRRSINLGQPLTGSPDYDPAVTCLHVHNHLAEAGLSQTADVERTLRRAAIVAALRENRRKRRMIYSTPAT